MTINYSQERLLELASRVAAYGDYGDVPEAADALRAFANVIGLVEKAKYGLVIRDIQPIPGFDGRVWTTEVSEPTAWVDGDSPAAVLFALAEKLQ